MKQSQWLLFIFVVFLILVQKEVGAQSIPLMIPHSGTVSVNGTPFNGNGQFKFAIVNKDCVLSPSDGACTTLWSNDGTIGAGAEPAAGVTIPVTNGLFAVKLGDVGLTGMRAIPAAVFNGVETYLRVWFNDGATGFQPLSPDRQLVSVPYAYHSETAGSIRGTDVLTIPAVAFRPIDSSTTYSQCLPQTLGYGGTGPGKFYAPVLLPHQVTINEFAFFWWDSSTTNNANATLVRLALPTVGSTIQMASVDSSGSAGIHSSSTTTAINDARIDNLNSQYYVEVTLPGTALTLCADGVRIKYTRNTP